MPRNEPTESEETVDSCGFLSQFGKSTDAGEWHSPIPEGYNRGRTKFVVVIGTVMSGLGKGIFSSSLAKLLKDKGLSVAPIKMEGYLNIDSGTLNPYRHGEVFVLADGCETDMDLGTYERLLNQDLTRRNFITAGQIYTDILEVGGTAGDYENGFYIEALRELAFEEGPESTCFVALTYILEPSILGEQKSKAAQLGIKRLMEAGVQPHIIACRAKNPVVEKVMEKIGMFSNVSMRRIFSMHDRESVYAIPEAMRAAGLDREILSLLGLHDRVNAPMEDRERLSWLDFSRKLFQPRKHTIELAIAGKYAALRDAYASIDKAIEHCSIQLNCTVKIRWLDTTDLNSDAACDTALATADALIVPGGFGSRGVEGKIRCIKSARASRKPFLGICLGFQMAVVEFGRNALGYADANSLEFDATTQHPLIGELPDQKKLEGILGGTMRLGAQDVILEPGSLASFLYGNKAEVRERFRHRYEVEPTAITELNAKGLVFSGRHPKFKIMQVLELPQSMHPYFIGAQYHPELTSRPLAPQPLFMGLVAAAIAQREPEFAQTELGRRWVRSAPQLCLS